MIALRLDIDETVGGGHFQRCMALAGSLPCDKVLLLFRADEGFFDQRSTAFSSLRIPRELPLEAEAAYLAKERPDLALEAIFSIYRMRAATPSWRCFPLTSRP